MGGGEIEVLRQSTCWNASTGGYVKALIVAGPGVQDVELVYPLYRLQEAGYKVVVVAPVNPGKKTFQGIGGLWFDSQWGLPGIGAAAVQADVLVLPGGVKAMEKLRLEEGLLAFIRKFHEDGGVIGSICSGAQLLISAELVKGRVVSCYPAMKIDVMNAGGMWHAGPVVVYDRIVTAPHYDHLGAWMKALLAAVESQRAYRNPAACAAAF